LSLKVTQNMPKRFTEQCLGKIANRAAFGRETILLENCAQRLELKDCRLEKLDVSQITLETLTQITGQLIAAADNGVSFSELFQNTQSDERFTDRSEIAA
jgi:hypothetical protein